MADEQLKSFISNYLYLSDLRNVDKTNPLTFELEPDHRTFLMVSSYDEPTFSQLPYNVLWLVCDPEDPWYNTVYRRTNHTNADGRKSTWEEITTFDMLYVVDQYYQAISDADPFELGIEGEFSLGPASTLKAGLILIPEVQGGDPVVVTFDYPGFLGARTPKEHTHPDKPRTMVHIDGEYSIDENYPDSVGDTDTFVSFDYSQLPEEGSVFFLTGNNPDRTNEWFGEWRLPTEDDVTYFIPTLIAVDARLASGAVELGDNATGQVEADGVFDDNTRDINPSDIVWTIENNAEGITIDQSGVITIPDISSDTTITVNAKLEDKYHPGTFVNGLLVINVKDLFTPVVPQSLAIIGNETQPEQTTGSYVFRVTYSDGATSDITPDTASSSAPIATFGINGDLTAMDITNDTPTVLSASSAIEGIILSASLPVTILAEVIPVSLTITGLATVQEEGTYTYDFVVSYSDGTTQDISMVDGATSSDVTSGIFNTDGELTTLDIVNDTSIVLEASFAVDGILLDASLTVNIVADSIPSSIEIIGASSIDEGETESYTFQVTYSDSTTRMLDLEDLDSFISDSVDLVVAGSVASVGDINANGSAILTVSYTELGHTITDTHNVTLVADPVPQSLVILGASSIREGETESYTYQVTMTDGSTKMVTVSDLASDNADLTVVGDDATVGSILADGAAELSASYTEDGITVNATHPVGLIAASAPQSLAILGASSIDEGETESYTFQVTYSDGTTSLVTVSDFASDNVDLVITDSDATVGSILVNGSAGLTASYTEDGVTVSASLPVDLVAAPAPQSLEILGSSTSIESGVELYTFKLTYSDGTTSLVDVTDFASDNVDVSISGNNTATVGSITSDGSAILSASYTEDGVTVSDTHELTYVANAAPTSLKIIGADTIQEGDQETFTFEVTYSDGSTSLVSVADFSSDGAAGVVSDNSVVTGGDIDADTSVVLSASYEEDGVSVTDTHNLNIEALPVPTSMEILGTDSINENDSSTYTFQVTMSDSTTKMVTVTDFASDDVSKATVLNNTTVNTMDISSDTTVSVSASYEEEGTTVSASKTINIVADVVPTSIEITGPISVDEESITSYTFQVTMSDSTTKTVTASTASADTGAFSTAGSFTAPTVTGPSSVVLSASYTEGDVTVDDTHVVSIGNTLNPLISISLSGLAQLDEGGNTTPLTVTATFEDSTTSVVTGSSDYVILSGGTYGSISDNIVTSGNVTENSNMVLEATYTIGGVTKTAEHTISIRAVAPIPVSVEISGPSEVDEGQTGSLIAVVTYDDNSTAAVTTSGTWSFAGPSEGASVDSSGIFSAPADVGNDTSVTVSFTYTENGTTLDDSHSILVKDIPVSGLSAAWGYDESGADIWPYTQAFIEALPNKLASPVIGQTLTFGTSGHTYLAIPESELSPGKALWYYWNGGTNPSILGGATWPLVGFLGSNKPAIISIAGENWHIYRSDFAGVLGPDTYAFFEDNMPSF